MVPRLEYRMCTYMAKTNLPTCIARLYYNPPGDRVSHS